MKIAFIGYGEVGRILAEDLASHVLTAFDAKLGSECGQRDARTRGAAWCRAGRVACRSGAGRRARDLCRHRQPGGEGARRPVCLGWRRTPFSLDFNSHPLARRSALRVLSMLPVAGMSKVQ